MNRANRLLFPLCLFTLLALPLILRLLRHPVDPPGVQIARPKPPQTVRAEAFIAEARSLHSYLSAVAALDSQESDVASMAITSAELETPESSTVLKMNAVLADRRVARILSHLQGMDRDVARKECLRLFDEKLANLNSEWHKFAPLIKEVRGSFTCLDLRRRHHALSSAVFLSTFFCTDKEALRLPLRWREKMNSSMRETEFDPDAYERDNGVPLTDVFPDALFELNIYTILLVRNGKDGLSEIEKSTQAQLPVMTMRPYLRWDEIRGKDGGEKTDLYVPYLRGWGHVSMPEARDKAITAVRASLQIDQQ